MDFFGLKWGTEHVWNKFRPLLSDLGAGLNDILITANISDYALFWKLKSGFRPNFIENSELRYRFLGHQKVLQKCYEKHIYTFFISCTVIDLGQNELY